MFSSVILYFGILCYDIALCFVVSCYVMLYCVFLLCIFLLHSYMSIHYRAFGSDVLPGIMFFSILFSRIAPVLLFVAAYYITIYLMRLGYIALW